MEIVGWCRHFCGWAVIGRRVVFRYGSVSFLAAHHVECAFPAALARTKALPDALPANLLVDAYPYTDDCIPLIPGKLSCGTGDDDRNLQANQCCFAFAALPCPRSVHGSGRTT